MCTILTLWLLSPKFESIGIWEQNISTFVHINKENYLAYYKHILGIVMRKFDTAKSLELEELCPVGNRKREKSWGIINVESREQRSSKDNHISEVRSKEMEQKQ